MRCQPRRPGIHARLVAILLIGSCVAFAPMAFAGDKNVTVAVIDFDTTPVSPTWSYEIPLYKVSQVAATTLSTELAQQGTLDVVTRQKMNHLLAEQDFQHGGRVDMSTAVRLGKVLGAPTVIFGQVNTFSIRKRKASVFGIGGKVMTAKVSVSAQLVDTQTAQVLATGEGEGRKRSGGVKIRRRGGYATEWHDTMLTEVFQEAMEDLAVSLAEDAAKLDPARFVVCRAGEVVGVEGDELVLNIGREDKAQHGQYYEVRRRGKVYRDSSGRVLGHKDETIGLIKITSIDGMHLSHAQIIDGDGFQVEDIVMQTGAPGETFRCMEQTFRRPRAPGQRAAAPQGHGQVGSSMSGGAADAAPLSPPASGQVKQAGPDGMRPNHDRTVGGQGGRAAALKGPGSLTVEQVSGHWGIHAEETFNHLKRRGAAKMNAFIFGEDLDEHFEKEMREDPELAARVKKVKQKIRNVDLRIDLNADGTFKSRSFDKATQSEKWVEGTWKLEGAFAVLTGTKVDGRSVKEPQVATFKVANNKLFGQPPEDDNNAQDAEAAMFWLLMMAFDGRFPNVDGVCLVRV